MWLNSLRSTNEVSWSHAEQLITNQLINIYADVAQLAEQLICNQQVIGSSPIIGFVLRNQYNIVQLNMRYFGWIPEWPKGTDCKSAANCFGGSNPPPSIRSTEHN